MNTPVLPAAREMCLTQNSGAQRQPDPKAARATVGDFSAAGAEEAGSPATVQPQLPQYTWYVIFILSAVSAFNYMDRLALAVLAPAIRADLQLSDTQLGLLTGLAFALFYAICGIPIARWADHGNRRNIIALALTTWSVMTALSGTAQHFWHLFMVRMGIGAGEAGSGPASASLLCDYVPLERRAIAFAVNGLGPFVGIMLGMALSGWLSDVIGWRWTFVVLGLPGIALAVVVRCTVREPIRGRLDNVEDATTGVSLRETIVALWRCRTYRLLVLAIIMGAFFNMGFFQWLPSFYVRSHGFGLSSVGTYLGVIIGLGSGIGGLIGGWVANKALQRDVGLPLRLSSMPIVLALPAAFGTLLVSSGVSSLVMFSLAVLLWSLPTGALAASLCSVVMPRMRATAGAITTFFTAVLGSGLGPLCVGLLSDLFAPSLGAEALRYALLFPIVLTPIMAILYYIAGKTLPEDLRAVARK